MTTDEMWLNKAKFLRLLMSFRKKSFENIGKGENAGNQHFLHFPQCFPS